RSTHSIFMSDYWYWRLIPCKETGSCNCFSTGNHSNEEKEEDTSHQVVVSDIMQLVRDKQEVPESTADEIMHQDIIPLYAADIQDQLKKQFAYLSGGRGGDGCPVITFPDYPAFSEIPEKEFQNVLTYLTSIPRGHCRVVNGPLNKNCDFVEDLLDNEIEDFKILMEVRK
ncbi:PREDICTED: guanine nucleotide exchange factor DBS-like, partial [Nestor notabilis]|uniref:guanine nucleotide exchange factor DBS-like n=1 Tax=Nestor notabilis TaxID=176057 RepID=UPI00052345F0